MTSITTTHLEAAIIDQVVAGIYRETPYAFVPVTDNDGRIILGVAVANEQGYSPIVGKTFTTTDEAGQWAHGLNDHIGRTREDVASIIISTMGGRPYGTVPET